ncbi:hypothetical protein DID88_009860 [Monilinia fructigena]|uniref:Uncharacterized protein n=1 Tax=Monilinia fructigena TaxID=38457 RepID=A0A395IKH2_9HELO|nr:hypothetical protein DID88_009860 [Monilinia fructigena]
MAGSLPADLNVPNESANYESDTDDDDPLRVELRKRKDYAALFLRCRYNRRDKLKQGLSKDHQQQIQWEENRIAELRGVFSAQERNNLLLSELTNLKRKWQGQAVINWGYRVNVTREMELSGESAIPKKSIPDDSGYGFSVSKITLSRRKDHLSLSEKAPSFDSYKIKKYSLTEVLEPNPGDDPWKLHTTENEPVEMIRYFHFPANNMQWIEKAIRRHYKETPDNQPQTSKILSRELWTGQQHGTPSDPIHARHMRSQCSYLEVNNVVTGHHHSSRDRINNSIVLFMPYLHWEMDRKRSQMANLTKTLTTEHQKKQNDYRIRGGGKLADFVKENRNKFGLLYKTEANDIINSDASGPTNESTPRVITRGLLSKIKIKSPMSHDSSEDSEDPILIAKNSARKACGLFLMHVAKVYEAMELEPDIRLVHRHLNDDPPFHPRRTLDQSYYFKLKNTEPRDKDQVVYRGTKEGRKIHGSTRVVMVDQLWMYILDENTIITSFPRRLGHNKPDSSGVHRCIRSRLDNIRQGQINSIYDLALLIMNECSTLFFDRTKPIDERPEVLDIFANAIGYVSEMKTSAFELFWRHLQILSGQHLKINPEKARVYLNINPEGLLLREAHDIVEELRMMSHICMEQLKVTQIFSKALETINGQVEPMHEMTDLLSLMLYELQKKNSSSSNSNVSGNTSPTGTTRARANNPMIKRTIDRSLDLINTISNHHKELHQLEGSAREIAEQLRDLLTLKQQQASIIEATAALDRADESVHQGRSIMIFTVITIIFLPLSFMSSIFGMNAKEFTGSGNSEMSIREQFEYMFPISIALTLFFLYLALKTPSPKLIKLPSIMYFLTTLALSSYYGFTGKAKKWEELFIYMNTGAAMKKLPKKRRDNVGFAYRWCAAQKTKYLRRKLCEEPQTSQQTATINSSESQVETRENFYPKYGDTRPGDSTQGDGIV